MLDESPEFTEVLAAVRSLKNCRGPGPDGLPAELLKQGGYLLTRHLHKPIYHIWCNETLPQGLSGRTVTLSQSTRKKGTNMCGNSHGISLLSVAENVAENER